MAIGDGGYDGDGTTSWSAADEPHHQNEEVVEDVDQQARRDMFDLTVCKIRNLNSPARRDTSLRKSVLIFNLLRCLQRENSYYWGYDVEMVANTSSSDDCDHAEEEDDDSTMSDESAAIMINEDSNCVAANNNDGGPDDDSETESAVFELSAIDSADHPSIEEDDRAVTPAACYQISPSSTAANRPDWNDRGAEEPDAEMMDIDHHHHDGSYVDNIDRRTDDAGNYLQEERVAVAAANTDLLITQSYRLIENGGYSMIDQSSSMQERVRSYGTMFSSGNGGGGGGEHRPFEHGRSFDLFA